MVEESFKRIVGLPRTVEELPCWEHFRDMDSWLMFRASRPNRKIATVANLKLDGMKKNRLLLEYVVPDEAPRSWRPKLNSNYGFNFVSTDFYVDRKLAKTKLTLPSSLRHGDSWSMRFSRKTRGFSPGIATLTTNDLKSYEVTNIEGHLPGFAAWSSELWGTFECDATSVLEKSKFIVEPLVSTKTISGLNWDGHTFDIEFRVAPRVSTLKHQQFRIEPESSVKIILPEPTHLAKAIEVFRAIEDFFDFIFLAKHSNPIFVSRLKDPRSGDCYYGSRGDMDPEYIYVVSSDPSLPDYIRDHRNEFPQNRQPLFYANEDGVDMEGVIRSWLEHHRVLKEFGRALVSLQKVGYDRRDERFMLLIGSLEMAYSRGLFQGKRGNRGLAKIHSSWVKKICAQIECSEDKAKVEAKIKPNNPGLGVILQEILGETHNYDPKAPSAWWPCNNQKLLEVVTKMRHCFVHGRPFNPRDITELNIRHNLNDINYVLAEAVIALVAARLGISKDKIIGKPNLRYEFLR